MPTETVRCRDCQYCLTAEASQSMRDLGYAYCAKRPARPVYLFIERKCHGYKKENQNG